ncbi:MAG: cation transporter [bacterium]|nr:cation transporter [bacterium]
MIRLLPHSRRLATAFVSLVFAALLTGFGCAPADQADSAAAGAPNPDPTQPRVAILEISGMTCHGCASGVQETLTGLPGVITAVVSSEDKTAEVTLERTAATGEAELRAAVDEKGYKVTDCTWDS